MFVRRFVALVIVTLAVAAFVFVGWPAYIGRGPDTPWDNVRMLVMGAMTGSLWSLAALALGALVITAIVAATVWLNRHVTGARPS